MICFTINIEVSVLDQLVDMTWTDFDEILLKNEYFL